MKRTIASLALLLTLVVGPNIARGEEQHIKVNLEPNGSSGVSGFVVLTQLPHGGAVVNVVASGLKPGTVYTSFYYEASDCTEPADPLETFTAGDDGSGHAHGKIDDDLDEVGSVSVRLGTAPEYGELQACAKVH